MTSRTATIVVDDAEPSASQTITTSASIHSSASLANATLALAAPPAAPPWRDRSDPQAGWLHVRQRDDRLRETDGGMGVAAQLLRKTRRTPGLRQQGPRAGNDRRATGAIGAKRERAREMAASLSEAQLDALIDRSCRFHATIRQVAAQQSAGLLDALRQATERSGRVRICGRGDAVFQ